MPLKRQLFFIFLAVLVGALWWLSRQPGPKPDTHSYTPIQHIERIEAARRKAAPAP